MKAIPSICFAILATATLSAEAIMPPLTLRQLTERSDLVVVGKVEGVEKGSLASTAIAKLRVLEIVKGEEIENVSVTYHPGVVCPAPATYKKNDIVVAFLRTSDAGTFTTGMSYGAKLLPENERKAFVKRTREYLSLTDTDDTHLKSKRVTSWLMKCIEDPSTRWDGIAN